ncbi:MAG: LamG-like jellyroll fold domain-containing protein [Bacteroidales bacterium]
MRRTVNVLIFLAGFFLASCEKYNLERINPLDPAIHKSTFSVQTLTVTELSSFYAIVGGIVTSNLGTEITERGIFYGISQKPEKDGKKVIIGSGIGSFSLPVRDLVSNNTYYVKAYATSNEDTVYGEQLSFVTTLNPEQVAYWNFENNCNDQIGIFNPITNGVIDVNYSVSHSVSSGLAAYFNGATSLVEIGYGNDLMNTTDFTISFWVRQNPTKVDQFVLGLAGWYGFHFEIANWDSGSCKFGANYSISDGTTGSQDLVFNGDGLTKDNGGWKGCTFSKDLNGQGGVSPILTNKWAHIVCIYNSNSNTTSLYINGMKVKEQDYDLYDEPFPDITGLKYKGQPNNKQLAFGFIQDKNYPTIPNDWADYSLPGNSHFLGFLDDVRIFHSAFTESEVSRLYSIENQ